MKAIFLFVLLSAGILGQLSAQNQQQYVYVVKMANCTHAPVARSQTGFRLEGLKGVITALHGVVDCPNIRLMDVQGRTLKNVIISKVDVQRDLALLTSPELESLPAIGIKGVEPDWNAVSEVRVIGHPLGVKYLPANLDVIAPATRLLKDQVPAREALMLECRSSPSPSMTVLSLHGDLVPGYSGAPILNRHEQVVAVANGGLSGGTVGICWAIPLQGISWKKKEEDPLFTKLVNSKCGVTPVSFNVEDGDTSVTFNIEDKVPPAFPITIKQSNHADSAVGGGHRMDTEIVIDAKGKMECSTYLSNVVFAQGFCAKVTVIVFNAAGEKIFSHEFSALCVGSQLGKYGGVDTAPKRKAKWQGQLPIDILGQIDKLAIVHSEAKKDVFGAGLAKILGEYSKTVVK